MQLKESVQNTKKFFHITLQNIKSLFVGGYQKLSKSSSFKFSCGSTSTRKNRKHQFYADFCNEWECSIEKAVKRKNSGPIIMKEAMRQEREEEESEDEDLYSSGSNSVKLAKSPLRNKEVEEKEEKNKKSSYWRKGEEKSQKNKKEDGYALAKKMKELEMIDASDMEQVLDVEEALHYYSRLKSPVYLDIVDKFFTDMYSEFSVPRAPLSLNSSKRRLGSIRF